MVFVDRHLCIHVCLCFQILTTEAPAEPTDVEPPPMISSVDPEEFDEGGDAPAKPDSTTPAATPSGGDQPDNEKLQIGGDSDAQSVDSSIIEKTSTEGLRQRLPTQLRYEEMSPFGLELGLVWFSRE